MRPVIAALATPALLLVAGCTTTAPTDTTVPPGGCDAGPAEAFKGQSGDAVAEQARHAAGAATVRVIRPGQAVTMDYRADRLNVELDDAGKVVAVRCG